MQSSGASETYSPTSPSSLSSLRKCSFGCPVLDSLLHGGLPCGSITELVGECGSAKTQICLQLLLSAQLPPRLGGLGSSSVYIFTENYFPARRLQQLAKGFVDAGKFLLTVARPPYPNDIRPSSPTAYSNAAADPCDNIFVQSIETVEELWEFLLQLRILISRPSPMPVKLVVIDSIAALFRSDFDNNAVDLAKRMEWFFKISSKLKQYAYEYEIAVLVTNQVVDYVDQEDAIEKVDSLNSMLSSSSGHLISDGRRVVPALGIGWSHCVNTRIFLSRDHQLCMDPDRPISRSISARSHTSVIQHLESELPDDLLLSLSQGDFAFSSHHQKQPNTTSRLDEQTTTADEIGTCNVTLQPNHHKEGIPPLSSVGQKRSGTLYSGKQTTEADENGAHGGISEWSICVDNQIKTKTRRILQVVFAPHLPPSSCEFVVESTQVRGLKAAPTSSRQTGRH